MHKFYLVADDPAYKVDLHQELTANTGGETIPDRSVDIVDPMPHSEYNSVVMLTQEEADALLSDLRVADVHRDPFEIGVELKAHGLRNGIFDRTYGTPTTTQKNWGLLRSISTSNNFYNVSSVSGNYTFNLDGEGVDIIIMDTGVEAGHPEFAVNADGTGGSRVVNHDWTQYGILSTPTGGFLGDCDGHGSNCASIAAGNTNGWAPKAAIYSLRVVGDGTSGPYSSILDGRQIDLLNEFQCWQSIRAFHNAKTVNPSTGYKRPTIVSCSYGYTIPYTQVTRINYRGVNNIVSTTTAAYGTIGVPEGGAGEHGYRYSSLEAEIRSTLATGVIIVGSAGNDRHKIDVTGGLDFNNYWTAYTGNSYYYHKGASPSATQGVICVGASAVTNTFDYKANFSCAGPRVDMYAPGVAILGAWANTTYATPAIQDARDSNYYLNKIGGTSQAAPQVTGMVALLTQIRPWMTATNVLNWMAATSVKNVLFEGAYGGSGYTQWGSVQSGTNAVLYWPYNSQDPLKIN
jgi:hypothetical protein